MIDLNPRDEPIYWMYLLQRARHRGDRRGIAEAQRHLRRLGVKVVYHQPGLQRKDRRQDAPRLLLARSLSLEIVLAILHAEGAA